MKDIQRKRFYAIRSKKKIDNRTIGYFLTHVENNFLNESATVNVIDFANVKSNKLTTYNDLITSEERVSLDLALDHNLIISQHSYRVDQVVYSILMIV